MIQSQIRQNYLVMAKQIITRSKSAKTGQVEKCKPSNSKQCPSQGSTKLTNVKTHRSRISQKDFTTCSFCHKVFMNKSNCKKHQMTHIREDVGIRHKIINVATSESGNNMLSNETCGGRDGKPQKYGKQTQATKTSIGHTIKNVAHDTPDSSNNMVSIKTHSCRAGKPQKKHGQKTQATKTSIGHTIKNVRQDTPDSNKMVSNETHGDREGKQPKYSQTTQGAKAQGIKWQTQEKRGRGRPRKASSKSQNIDNLTSIKTESHPKVQQSKDVTHDVCKSKEEKMAEGMSKTGCNKRVCRFCKKKLFNVANCKRHERLHTGEKPYGCKYCPDSFPNSTYLKRHVIKIHKSKTVDCRMDHDGGVSNIAIVSNHLYRDQGPAMTDDLHGNGNETRKVSKKKVTWAVPTIFHYVNRATTSKKANKIKKFGPLKRGKSSKLASRNRVQEQRNAVYSPNVAHGTAQHEQISPCREDDVLEYDRGEFQKIPFCKVLAVAADIDSHPKLTREMTTQKKVVSKFNQKDVENGHNLAGKIKTGHNLQQGEPNPLQRREQNTITNEEEMFEDQEEVQTQILLNPTVANDLENDGPLLTCNRGRSRHFQSPKSTMTSTSTTQQMTGVDSINSCNSSSKFSNKSVKSCRKISSLQVLRGKQTNGNTKITQVLNEEDRRQMVCQFCKKTFATATSRLKHEELHTIKPYGCKICSVAFANVTYLEQHVNRMHKNVISQMLTMETDQELMEQDLHHMDTMPDTRGKPTEDSTFVTGEETGPDFPGRSQVKSPTQLIKTETHHFWVKSPEVFECTTCHFEFASRRLLSSHEKCVHGRDLFVCQYCKKSFANVQARIRHERLHTNEASYTCKFCLKGFPNTTYISRHVQKVHRSEVEESGRIMKEKYCKEHQSHPVKDLKDTNDIGEEAKTRSKALEQSGVVCEMAKGTGSFKNLSVDIMEGTDLGVAKRPTTRSQGVAQFVGIQQPTFSQEMDNGSSSDCQKQITGDFVLARTKQSQVLLQDLDAQGIQNYKERYNSSFDLEDLDDMGLATPTQPKANHLENVTGMVIQGTRIDNNNLNLGDHHNDSIDQLKVLNTMRGPQERRSTKGIKQGGTAKKPKHWVKTCLHVPNEQESTRTATLVIKKEKITSKKTGPKNKHKSLRRSKNENTTSDEQHGRNKLENIIHQSSQEVGTPKTLSSKLPSKCSYCGQHFTRKYNCSIHEQYVHLGLKPYKCLACGLAFGYPYDLLRHRKKLHIGKAHLQKVEKRRAEINTTKRSKIPKVNVSTKKGKIPKGKATARKPSVNEIKPASQKLLQSHDRSKQPDTCRYCGKTFTRQNNARTHEKTVHLKLKLFRCEECDTSFRKSNQLYRHKRQIHQIRRPSGSNIDSQRQKVLKSKGQKKQASNNNLIDTSLTNTTIDTSLNKTPTDTSVYNTLIDTSLNKTPTDTSMYNTPIDTSLNKTPIDTSLNNTPIDTSLNKTPTDTSMYNTLIDTSLYKTTIGTSMYTSMNNTPIDISMNIDKAKTGCPTKVTTEDIPSGDRHLTATKAVDTGCNIRPTDSDTGTSINNITQPGHAKINNSYKANTCHEVTDNSSKDTCTVHKTPLATNTAEVSAFTQYSDTSLNKDKAHALPRHSDLEKAPLSSLDKVSSKAKSKSVMDQKYTAWICDVCDMEFVGKKHLVYHQRCHDNDRNGSDKIRGQELIVKPSKNSNQNTYNEVYCSPEGFFKCNFCPTTFTQKRQLRSHEFVHTRNTDQTLGCPQCGTEYKRRKDWVTHMNCHEMVLVYNCKYCEKRFKVIKNWWTHEKHHENLTK